MALREAFYEAAIVPELWRRTLNAAGSAWDTDGVAILSYPNCLNGLIFSDGLEAVCGRFITEGWYKQDVRAIRGVPYVRSGHDIVTDFDIFTREELDQLPFYAEFLAQSGFRWFAGSILAESGGALITLSLDRRAERGPFTKEELARIRSDLPHLRRAARLAKKSRLAYAEGLADSLERFRSGAMLIDRTGRVVRCNEKAERYLGDHLYIAASRLRSPHRESNKALQDLIAALTRPIVECGNTAPTSALLHRSNGLPLILQSYPIVRQACDVFQGAKGILLITDPSEHRRVPHDVLQLVFQLTPAELRIATSLMRGLDTQQTATEHQIGIQTVRFHLKSIFAKTGTSNQAQLVSLLARFSE